MPWAITVTLDTDKTDVGTVIAAFTDTDATVFDYSARLHATAADMNNFVSAAIAARNAWQARKTSQNNYQTTILNAFTAAGG